MARRWRSAGISAAFALLLPVSAFAVQDEEKPPPATVTFMGVEVEPMDALMVVTTDVNIRSQPDTKGDKLGLLEVGERVDVVGDAEGSWFAVQRDGKDLGFVYGPALKQVMDVVVKEPLRGDFKGPGGEACEYIVRFERLGATSSETFRAADYEIGWRCKFGGSSGDWTTTVGFMFMPEAPIRKRPPSYQISVDILEMTETVENPVTVTYLYRPDSKELVFDGVGPDGYGTPPSEKTVEVADLPQALRHVAVAVTTIWNAKVWSKIKKTSQ